MYPAVAEMLSMSSEGYILFSDDLFLSAVPCSLVLGIFPQGLVAVTVAAQVASISARFSTPVLFFLPVARSHSPQAWKSYLHSPIAHKEIKHLIRCLCLAKQLRGGTVQKQSSRQPGKMTQCSFYICFTKQSIAISHWPEELCVIHFEWVFDEHF